VRADGKHVFNMPSVSRFTEGKSSVRIIDVPWICYASRNHGGNGDGRYVLFLL